MYHREGQNVLRSGQIRRDNPGACRLLSSGGLTIGPSEASFSRCHYPSGACRKAASSSSSNVSRDDRQPVEQSRAVHARITIEHEL